MPIVMIGFNYRRTGIHLREQAHLAPTQIGQALESLQQWPERVILSTCNRLEVYLAAEDIAAAQADLEAFMRHLLPALPASALYSHHDHAAILHLFQVSAGLDSMLLGEAQILGQVGRALEAAQGAGSIGPLLTRLFTQALAIGKRIRTETALSRTSTSLGQLSLRLAAQHGHQWPGARVVIVGAGEIAQQVGKALRHARKAPTQCPSEANPLPHLTWVNRDQTKADDLAQRIGGYVRPWAELASAIAQADVVITATSAPQPIVTAQTIGHRQRPLTLIDLSLPRNIDPQVDQLEGLHRYDLDTLKSILAVQQARQIEAVEQAQAILSEEVANFEAWLAARQATPLIQALRQQAAQIAHSEVQQTLKRLGDLSPQEAQLIEQLGQRIISKLLHHPTVYIKENAAHTQLIESLSACFNLPKQGTSSA